MRFALQWWGEVNRDLGEIHSELRVEPFQELDPSGIFYHAEVPSKDIPLTDWLRVDIFAADGTQLGCIRGHI